MQTEQTESSGKVLQALDPVHVEYLYHALREMELHPRDLYVLLPGVSRHFPSGVVLRYMLRFHHDDGTVGYVQARQGRYTYDTLSKAMTALRALLANNGAWRIEAMYGGAKNIFVTFQACYANHHDPAPLDLGGSDLRRDGFFNRQRLRELQTAIQRIRRDYQD